MGKKHPRRLRFTNCNEKLKKANDVSVMEIMVESEILLDRYLRFILVHTENQHDIEQLIRENPQYGHFFRHAS